MRCSVARGHRFFKWKMLRESGPYGHLMITTDTLILGDFNANHLSWYSSSTDSRGTMLESMVSDSNFGILNWDYPTRLPGNANSSSPDVSLASASLITSTNWQTKTNLGSAHLSILIS